MGRGCLLLARLSLARGRRPPAADSRPPARPGRWVAAHDGKRL